jgi:hypothetical protein
MSMARSVAGLTPDDQRMLRSVEALYGPPRWDRGDWQTDSGVSRSRIEIAGRPLGPLVLQTLLTIIVAFFAWYTFLGGAASLRSAASFALTAAGLVRPSETAPVSAEYLLAVRTVADAGTLAPTDPVVLKLKALLDEISPKCREDRYAVAAAVIAAHDALARSGLEASSVSILVAANATLSEQTRRSWPTSCSDVIQRIVATRTAAH